MQPNGKIIEDEAFATITFTRTYHHTAEQIWDAIATPHGLSGWLMATYTLIDGRVGGRFDLIFGPSGYSSTGTILEWDPPHVLEYEWNIAPVPEMPRGEHAIFRYELTPNGDSTHLLVTYRRITKETARGFLPGLHAFLDRLEAQLDQQPMPDWGERFTGLISDYPEWRGHASHSGE